MKSLIRNLRIIFILLAIAALTGCGDSTSSGNSISGTASKGPIDGGSVEVYALLADGTKGDLLGTATTSAIPVQLWWKLAGEHTLMKLPAFL